MRNIFTIPDPELTQDSSVDPMGIRIIWTYYGQSIFNDRITTIANDIRIFTINLFHHHIINRLFQDYPEEIQIAKKRFKHWSTDLEIKSGLLIFLEDVVTWSFLESKANPDSYINSLGMFGMSKAQILLNTSSPKSIFIHAHKKEGLLKKQIILGMTGRYKGPMIKMGFFNSNFEINNTQSNEWLKIDKLINNWEEASALQKNILDLFIKHVFPISKNEHPQISLDDLKKFKLWNKIREGYVNCFGSEKPENEIRSYWKDKLGLNSGAAGTLFNQISYLKAGDFLDHATIFRNALLSLNNEPVEYNKLNLILTIEPFLSDVEYLLRFLSQIGIKNIHSNANDIQLLRNQITSTDLSNLSDCPSQLKELFRIATLPGPLDDWIRNLLEYHKNIMLIRGSNIWVEMDKSGNVKHYFAPILDSKINTIPKYLQMKPWLHTYYLETLRSIHKGLN